MRAPLPDSSPTPPVHTAARRPGRNIELKARIADLDTARRIAERIATSRLATQRQIDTYFHVSHGRLKLREIYGLAAELIWYARPDAAGPKASDYLLAPIGDAEPLKQALAAALGVRAVVDKRREIYLWDNVRIHLDDVRGLGGFLEFEAVLGPDIDDERGKAQLARLSSEFGLAKEQLLRGSYAELVASTSNRG